MGGQKGIAGNAPDIPRRPQNRPLTAGEGSAGNIGANKPGIDAKSPKAW